MLYDERRFQSYIKLNDLVDEFNKISRSVKTKEELIKEQSKIIDSMPRVSIKGSYYNNDIKLKKEIDDLKRAFDKFKEEKYREENKSRSLEHKTEELKEEVKYLRTLNNQLCESIAKGKDS